jgi:6-phosphogluconolactonase
MFISSALGLGLAVLTLAAMAAPAANQGPLYVYVGTYTDKSSKGIYVYRFQPESGKLDSIGLAAETPNPTFLAIHPSRKYLYAANEIGKYKAENTGSVSAFRIDAATGKLIPLNTVSSHGNGPAHVTVDRSGKFVLAANYGGGTVTVLPIGADGSLGEATSSIQHKGSSVDKSRQRGPHAHSINMSPDNRFAIAADLGLDKLLVYRFDASKGILEPNDPPSVSLAPGSGPRHFTFHPNGRVAYCINEMKSTVTVFDWNADRGVLTGKQTVSTLPKDFSGESSTAEVLVHPNGKFLFGSNRGHDSVAVFAIGADGTLTPVEITPVQVKTPRNFAIDPSGTFLFAEGQASDNIVLFRLDPKTGHLIPSGTSVDVGAPVCIRFVQQ